MTPAPKLGVITTYGPADDSWMFWAVDTEGFLWLLSRYDHQWHRQDRFAQPEEPPCTPPPPTP